MGPPCLNDGKGTCRPCGWGCSVGGGEGRGCVWVWKGLEREAAGLSSWHPGGCLRREPGKAESSGLSLGTTQGYTPLGGLPFLEPLPSIYREAWVPWGWGASH